MTEPPVAADREASEHLGVLQRQLARLPLAYGVFDFVIVWLLWREGLALAALAWLVVYLGVQGLRWQRARRALASDDGDARQTLQALGVVMVALGAWRIVPVLLLFSRPAPQAQVLLTLVYLGMASAAVVTAGGRWRTFLAWAVLACGSLAAAWAWQGTAQGWAIAVIIVALVATLTAYVHDQQRTLATMVRLVHDNQRLAAALRAERDQVAAASRSQTRFFTAASHDLRQPLHALSMNASALALLARDQPDPRLRSISDGIQRSLGHGQALIDNLLDIARLDAGAVQPEWQPVPVAELLASVREAFAPMADEQGLWLRHEVDPDAAAAVRADPALLRRILHNLVGNAIKYTPHGGVTLRAVAADAGRVRLEVADTGPGIAADDHERVFGEFVQGEHGVHPARERGLGLGLAIVRRIARLLDAELQLHSAPGAGTRVTLELAAAPWQTVT